MSRLRKSAPNTSWVASVRNVVTSPRNCPRSVADGMLPGCLKFTLLLFIRRMAGLPGS